MPGGIVGGRVVVGDDQARRPGAAPAPDGAGRRDEAGDSLVKGAYPAGNLVQGVLGVNPGRARPAVTDALALQEGEYLPSLLIEPQRPRRAREPRALQVGEQRVHGRRPRTGRTANRVPDPHRPADIPALKPLLSHETMLALRCGPFAGRS